MFFNTSCPSSPIRLRRSVHKIESYRKRNTRPRPHKATQVFKLNFFFFSTVWLRTLIQACSTSYSESSCLPTVSKLRYSSPTCSNCFLLASEQSKPFIQQAMLVFGRIFGQDRQHDLIYRFRLHLQYLLLYDNSGQEMGRKK